MKNRVFIVLAMFFFCLCCGSCGIQRQTPRQDGTAPNPADIDRNAIACTSYDAELVRAQLSAAEPDDSYQNIAGAVVPHYAPAMYMAADILAAVDTAPETVVVIAPNHTGKGDPVQICDSGYYWQSGHIAGNATFSKQLADALHLDINASTAQEDWSASLLMPYIAHFFPDATVCTVMLSRGAGDVQVQALAENLAKLSKTQDIFVLGSADFSHYQDERTARNCDAETARILAAGDRAQLLQLGNDHLDSPETVAVLLTYAALLEREFVEADSLLETFVQDGRRMAGSYYAYVLT